MFFKFLIGPMVALGVTLAGPSIGFAQVEGQSLLDQTAEVEGFGSVRYRAPKEGSVGLPIVLVHGIYGGASHRTWRELVPLLDAESKAVWLLDLPGVGESSKPKKVWTMADLDSFLEIFLENVVQQRATVVAESLLTLNALTVAGKRPDLIRRLVLISPVGINSLASPPSEREARLFDRLFNGPDEASVSFWQNLLTDNSLRYYLAFGFADDSRVDESLLNDYRVMRPVLEQRWITLAFVGGQFWRPFAEAAEGVFVPTLALFGAQYEAFADTPPTRASDLLAIRPDFDAIEIQGSGSVSQRENPAAVAAEIIRFSVED
jgi:pimeloyl-ACP methyl ester carboxylesterase